VIDELWMNMRVNIHEYTIGSEPLRAVAGVRWLGLLEQISVILRWRFGLG
jgi:hypothetical protein